MKNLHKIIEFIYQRPMLFGILLSFITGVYLYWDYGVINRSSLNFIWNLELHQSDEIQKIFSVYGFFSGVITLISKLFFIPVILSVQLLMLIVHALILYLMLKIALYLNFAKITRWALIFLLLAHPTYNDFRVDIIDEPIYWLLWLFAIYILMQYHKTHFLFVTSVWFLSFLLASTVSVIAWMWIFLFPIGILLWPNWRKKPVIYAILVYLLLGSLLFLMPIYKGISPYDLFEKMVVDNHLQFIHNLADESSKWLKEDDWFMMGLFIFSGGVSLVILRSILSFGLICSFLAIYAFKKNQIKAIAGQTRQFLIYILIFDLFSLVVLFVLSVNQDKTIYFTTSFIVFLFSALGLSYILRKIYFNQYPKHVSLIIVWFLVAYFASGMISFGPKKDYLKIAGNSLIDTKQLYSNDATVLFYAGHKPNPQSEVYLKMIATQKEKFTIAYMLNRNNQLPDYLRYLAVIREFENNRGDRLLVLTEKQGK